MVPEMELFPSHILRIREFLESIPDRKIFRARLSRSWPEGGGKDVVLMGDVGVELGSPETESCSVLLWTGDASLVRDGVVSLIGPDLAEARQKSMAFGKIVLLHVEGFTEENTFHRYREMEQMRFLLDLKGYMLRATSQYQREWCRVSRDALEKGFCLSILGSSLMRVFRELDYCKGMEIVFITEDRDTIRKVREMTRDTSRIIAAMNKMADEMSFDCDECDYRDVCNDADYLKKMRTVYRRKATGEEPWEKHES
ncbi:MAG TPA: hypothetical protein PLA82_08765 [Deltaproteobacteria bacterium]|nr:hypothetical protein [Deltaproteobacteria bacterium]